MVSNSRRRTCPLTTADLCRRGHPARCASPHLRIGARRAVDRLRCQARTKGASLDSLELGMAVFRGSHVSVGSPGSVDYFEIQKAYQEERLKDRDRPVRI